MKTDVTGTYQLINYGYYYKKTQTFEPISECYAGVIHYSADGYMSVILRFAEKPEKFDEMVGYCGTYEVQENKIHHLVTMSVRPEYEKQLLTRNFKIENNHLELEFENTDEFKKYSIWKKI